MKNTNIYYAKKLIRKIPSAGCFVYQLTAWMIKKKELIKVGTVEQSSGMTVGDTGEVWKILQSAKIAPKNVGVHDNMFTYLIENNIQIKELNI